MQNPELVKKDLTSIYNMSVKDIISNIRIDTNGEWVLGVKFTTALRIKQLQLLEKISEDIDYIQKKVLDIEHVCYIINDKLERR